MLLAIQASGTTISFLNMKTVVYCHENMCTVCRVSHDVEKWGTSGGENRLLIHGEKTYAFEDDVQDCGLFANSCTPVTLTDEKGTRLFPSTSFSLSLISLLLKHNTPLHTAGLMVGYKF